MTCHFMRLYRWLIHRKATESLVGMWLELAKSLNSHVPRCSLSMRNCLKVCDKTWYWKYPSCCIFYANGKQHNIQQCYWQWLVVLLTWFWYNSFSCCFSFYSFTFLLCISYCCFSVSVSLILFLSLHPVWLSFLLFLFAFFLTRTSISSKLRLSPLFSLAAFNLTVLLCCHLC